MINGKKSCRSTQGPSVSLFSLADLFLISNFAQVIVTYRRHAPFQSDLSEKMVFIGGPGPVGLREVNEKTTPIHPHNFLPTAEGASFQSTGCKSKCPG
jgi:hypothetical protein